MVNMNEEEAGKAGTSQQDDSMSSDDFDFDPNAPVDEEADEEGDDELDSDDEEDSEDEDSDVDEMELSDLGVQRNRDEEEEEREVIDVDDDDNNEQPEESDYQNEEYKIWKKNAPFLYDLVITTDWDWPSQTVEWMPTPAERPPNRDCQIHRLVIGTQTDGREPAHLIICRAQLPDIDLISKKRRCDLDDNGGGYGSCDVGSKVESFIRIRHEGDVNRARVMPRNSFKIATKSSTGKVLLFDYSKHSSDESKCTPQLTLTGHSEEGFGLAWSPLIEKRLLSSAKDGLVCFYDLLDQQLDGSHVEPVQTWRHHQGEATDVAWHHFHPEFFGSVGVDRTLSICDARTPSKPILKQADAHSGDINAIDFNPFNENILLTGSQDKTVKLWDLRQIKTELHQFVGHTDQILQVHWSPTNESIFGSCGEDRRLYLWDVTRIGGKKVDADCDLPPELMFIHAGHTGTVTDFSFNAQLPGLVASISENNKLHLWRMGEHCDFMRNNVTLKPSA